MSLFNKIFRSSENEVPKAKIGWRLLTDLGQLDELVELSHARPLLIFKHSTRCNISRMALRQFENEFVLEDQIAPYFLDLLENRMLSNEIAARFEVIHQSPQLLLISKGNCIFNTSHNSIDAELLKSYL
jgi:bacillithiol system protein YtxJ